MNEQNQTDPFDPIESYIRPIRSVLFIDDQFPTFGENSAAEFSESERARALWRACTERGWLCDIDNSADWQSQERMQRLAACDLLVLDLHLVGEDSRPARVIVRDLARSETPNLIVLYTSDPKQEDVLLSVAAYARGACIAALENEVAFELDELEIEWAMDDFVSFLEGSTRWMRTFSAAARAAGQSVEKEAGITLLERELESRFEAERTEAPLTIEKIHVVGNRWFQCGNLFLTVIQKPQEPGSEREADVLLDGLEAAVREWSPVWLACLIASSRRAVEKGSFRDDAVLPDASLQRGLLRYVQAAEDTDERGRRAWEIASHLLSRRFHFAAREMSVQLLGRTTLHSDDQDRTEGELELFQLNAFLCSEEFTRHHLRVGSIFRQVDSEEYWVCVTPACDMVPRDRKRSIDPWAVELDPVRPMLALRLVIRRRAERNDALNKAERGRHLFFKDQSNPEAGVIVASCFNTKTDEPNPQLEQLFAMDRARVHNGQLMVQRCVSDEEGVLSLATVNCVAACQLRAPYAERLTHVVGGHLSRIGVNFMSMGGDPENDEE